MTTERQMRRAKAGETYAATAKRRPKRAKTDERPRHRLQQFKVRCSLESAFYLLVEAHDSDEAELVAENYCREHDEQEDCFWDSEASYKHSKFEAEET